MQVNYFDSDGIYTHSAELPTNPVSGKPFDHNPAVCTPDRVPIYNPEKHRVRWNSGVWIVEVLAAQETDPEPVPEPEQPRFPHFFGNEKLDLFTMQEQLAVVTATMTDPVVKLMYDRLLGAAYLTYEDPETEQGLSLLVEKELLAPERKLEIVAFMQPK